ncbi:MAG: fibronectin type III domain-containing protein [Streptomyces sp.]|nr:fibronectin type III domain-containing protein [Streptomyces sp.]
MPEFLQGQADVPGVGKVKKRYIAIPAALAAAYVGWRWYQSSRSEADAPAGSDGLYSSDDLSDYGLSTTGGSSTVTGNTGSTSTDATSDTTIDDNAEWTRESVEYLTNMGYDGSVVAGALGEFLARRALDKTEATIARAAMAAKGEPPVNRPWTVIEEAATGTGTLAAPTNLRVSAHTDSTITLQFDKVDGALHYRLYRSDLGEEPIGDSYDTTVIAKGLTPNKSYPFFVRAFGTTGKAGGKSSVVTGKTDAVKLTKPTGLKASSITRTSFRASCTAVKGATGYRWKLDGKQVAPSDAPYRDFTGLKPNSVHSVEVAADNSTQAPGPWSTPIKPRTKK